MSDPGGDDVLVGVVAAHRRGQPLHHELQALGARFVAVARTAPLYRLLALPGGGVPRGGLVRVVSGGAAVEVELFGLAVAAIGALAAALPAPLAVGRLALADDRSELGLVCESWAMATARDVTMYGSWPAYLAARTPPRRPAPATPG